MNECGVVDGAFDVSRTRFYPLVTSMLVHSAVSTPSHVRGSTALFVPVNILVTEFDFYHYGYTPSMMQQVKFSRLVKQMIIDDCCRRIAMAHAAYGCAVQQAIDQVILSNNFTRDELNPETLRKIYQRKYKDLEDEYREFFGSLTSKENKKSKKKCCICPNTKKQL